MTIMLEQARFVFKGALRTESFVEFAQHRASRLGLAIGICTVSDKAITIDISGASELVDAFEMACSLGPQDCLVFDVARDRLAMAS
jgi:acylphosphatase